MVAWSRGNAHEASEFFQQTVLKDPLYMDAWLRLAESEAALGRPEKSRKILIFVEALISGIFRWQWNRMLLARDLGMDDILTTVKKLPEAKQNLLPHPDPLEYQSHLYQFSTPVHSFQSTTDPDNAALFPNPLATLNFNLPHKYQFEWDC